MTGFWVILNVNSAFFKLTLVSSTALKFREPLLNQTAQFLPVQNKVAVLLGSILF